MDRYGTRPFSSFGKRLEIARLTKFVDCGANSVEDLLGAAQRINLANEVAVTIIATNRLGLLVEDSQPAFNRGLGVIRAMFEFGSPQQSAYEFLGGGVQINDKIKLPLLIGQEIVQHASLIDRPRETVQQAARLAIGGEQTSLDDRHHDLVRCQLPSIDILSDS